MIVRKVMCYIAIFFVILIVSSSTFARLFTDKNPFQLEEINLEDAQLPPFWLEGSNPEFILGTDTQGRDIFATLLYSTRISLIIALVAVLFSMLIGVLLGLLSGYYGGYIDTVIMRIVDIKLALPAILLAMLVGGVMRNVFRIENVFISVLIIIISLIFASWTRYTRAIRSIVLREKEKEYISAARLMGLSSVRIIIRHIVPNVRSMVGVIMIIDFANCILLEATLSFLGLGLPPVVPSLGTTIRVGTNYLLSGSWWIVLFPALTLVVLIYSINVIKDYIERQRQRR